jgi:hypothetical protein
MFGFTHYYSFARDSPQRLHPRIALFNHRYFGILLVRGELLFCTRSVPSSHLLVTNVVFGFIIRP